MEITLDAAMNSPTERELLESIRDCFSGVWSHSSIGRTFLAQITAALSQPAAQEPAACPQCGSKDKWFTPYPCDQQWAHPWHRHPPQPAPAKINAAHQEEFLSGGASLNSHSPDCAAPAPSAEASGEREIERACRWNAEKCVAGLRDKIAKLEGDNG